VTAGADRPSVFWILLDAARADALEPYGAPAGSSPAIAQLASRGAALPHAYATSCWTLPSHTSMFAGGLSRAFGLGQAPGGKPQGAAPVVAGLADRWLPEVMRRAGYATGAVSTNVWVSPLSGFGTGFEEFEVIDGGRQASLDRTSVRARVKRSIEALRANVDDGAAEAEQVFRRWSELPRDRPAFWFVNLLECHSPYMPPRAYADMPALGRLRAAEEASRHLNLDAIWRACMGGWDIPQEAIERMRHLYASSVRYVDDWVGRVLEMLDAAGRLDDTLVIVSSDHGENLGEGNLITHAYSLDERLIHVPLVTAGPVALEEDGPCSLAEMPRRICDAVGVEHPWHDDDLPAGAAVAQFDPPRAAPGQEQVSEMVARWGLGEEAARRFTTPLECATDGRLKLLRRGEHEEVYDLEADPLELSPRVTYDFGAESLAHLRAALDHPAARAVTSHEPELASVAPGADVAGLEERMRLLGYM
jgi:arylsulfatase A-like enzyme